MQIEAPKEIKKYEQTELEFDKSISNVSEELILNKLNVSKSEIQEIINEIQFDSTQDNGSIITDHECKVNEKYEILYSNELVNNFRRINKTILGFNQYIKNGGYIILKYKELDDYELDLKKNTSSILYPFRMIWYYLFQRACLKIPHLNKIYFFLTKGKNRVLSKTEVWGRLTYCGYDVRSDINFKNYNLILAKKVQTVSDNPTPSFVPIIQLNRVSLNGHLIKVHKVRSMYPYSEFIQKKIFELNSLNSTGKINNDFRITKIGKICRKYWLDELPQFLDWMRGEIKLVGIRAMSQHYFSLYSKEYQNLFYKVKPGFFSPIFDENTASFEDIQRTEQEYLEKYIKHPILTDIEYLIKTITHIFKGVRSK
jgi:lipopolysaccharide/colanic/teichoic acid biosynthesis glycosyltransferase